MTENSEDNTKNTTKNDTAAEKSAVDRSEQFRHLRRKVVKGAVAGGVMGGFLGLFHQLRNAAVPSVGRRGDLGILRPPGAVDEKEFLARCIRCTRCADACESGCIRFFGAEAGSLEGTPYIMPEEKSCVLCLNCGQACPSAALEPLEKKDQVKMGVAVVDKRLCVSHNRTGICGACHTVCPFRNKAITQGIRNAPTVDEDHCVGCGFCEEACIVKDRRAIQVKTTRT